MDVVSVFIGVYEMLKRLFEWMLPVKKKPVEERKEVSCDELSRVLCFEGVTEESMRKQGWGSALGGYVQWSWADGSDNERGYESIGFSVKNLKIEITDYRDKHYSDHDAEIRYGLSDVSASLRFENCHFFQSNIDETGIKFVPGFYDLGIGESLSFVRNTEGCEFSFPDHSRVVFEQNDFTHILVKRNDSNKSKGVSLKFKGNKFSGNDKSKGVSLTFKGNKFKKLDLDFPFPCEYPISCHFVGGNEIDVLTWDQVVNRREFDPHGNVVKYDDVQEYNLFRIFFGRNEKIGRRLLNTRYVKRYGGRFHDMRDLFVKLKNLAHVRGDIGQENTIASYISLVEYAQVKNDKWYKSWQGWQDWLLMWWRWRSSKFYTSWLRPFGWLVVGYVVLNLIPMIWIGDYSWREWLEFSVLSPAKIPSFADSLETILGTKMTGFDKIGLHVMGIVRLIWIALCGYAFRNAIRTYLSR